jgi:hypothetical protein
MEHLFELYTIFQDPVINGRMVDGHPTLLHEVFHPAVAQG